VARASVQWSVAVAAMLSLASPAAAVEIPLAEDGGPRLSAKAVFVTGLDSGKVYLTRKADAVKPVASLTKLMAALAMVDRGLDFNKGTVITRQDWQVALRGARTRLELKWTYRNRDLLHAALMSSDNRAVSALGRAVGLDAVGLVKLMNARATVMGLRKTRFKGPVGIHHGNTSTAREMAAIVTAAGQNPSLSKIMSTAGHMIVPMRGYLKRWYRNTNPLVGESETRRFTASKTGFNDKAGYCLAATVKLRGRGTFAVVLLGSESKYWRVKDLRRVLIWLEQGKQQRHSL
jgi:D-alanyl-D-alanine endopeptidase (penicillin-binding protein 7)